MKLSLRHLKEWEKEKKGLEEQLVVVREKCRISEQAFGQLKLLAEAKAKLFQDTAAHLSTVEKSYTSVSSFDVKRG